MTETLEKIQTILKESKTIALFSKKHSEDYKLLAKEALGYAFSERKFNIISLPENPEFKKKWKAVLPDSANCLFPQQTSIRIPKNQYKVKEISYGDDEGFLSLVITSENGELKKEDISFEPVLPKADAVFCFFEPDDMELLREFKTQLAFPEKEKIIFFTSGAEMTFAEKISKIIKSVIPNLFSSPKISTLLFASLITETNNFVRPVSQEVLRFGSELLSLNADKETVKSIVNENKTISSARLLGRALARTHKDEKLGVSWTFLSQKDFEKTENLDCPQFYLYNLVQQLREFIPFCPLSLLFWQNNKAISVMAVSDDEKTLIPLAKNFSIKPESKFLIAGPFGGFSEAELHFRKILNETDTLKI